MCLQSFRVDPHPDGEGLMQVLSRPPSGWPALVLNADFRPLS